MRNDSESTVTRARIDKAIADARQLRSEALMTMVHALVAGMRRNYVEKRCKTPTAPCEACP
jgi:hypothetical protein